MAHQRYLFPRWANRVPLFIAVGVLGLVGAAGAGLWYFGTQKFLEVGYQPVQPVEYSHKLHAGDLGMDCRYCHSTVERSAFAALPATQTCMNCHTKVKADSPLLKKVRESFVSDKAIPWVRVHDLPDYVYFDHSAHLAAGVGCSSCHGRIDQMARVRQEQPLSMGWCLDCHRDAAPNLRPPSRITDMTFVPDEARRGQKPLAANGRELHPPTHCSGCHR